MRYEIFYIGLNKIAVLSMHTSTVPVRIQGRVYEMHLYHYSSRIRLPS